MAVRTGAGGVHVSMFGTIGTQRVGDAEVACIFIVKSQCQERGTGAVEKVTYSFFNISAVVEN